MRILFVTAVAAESEAVQSGGAPHVITSGLGRTNAAAATTEAIIRDGPFDAVVSAGVAGALPTSESAPLAPGDAIVATRCVYVEEGLLTSDGFRDVRALGFPLGDFEGNEVPVDGRLLAALTSDYEAGPIATVATCSGTDEAARDVARRTGARAEAMEGAAVVHAARRLRVPAIELRVISNTTGDRPHQQWDLPRALERLTDVIGRARTTLATSLD